MNDTTSNVRENPTIFDNFRQNYHYFSFFSDQSSSKCSSPISRSESIYKSESSLAMSISSNNKPVSVNSMKTLASQIVAYHFCQSDNAPSCLIPEFIHR